MSAQAENNVDTWLKDAPYYAGDLALRLIRAHKIACEIEPVTAMVILPLIARAREIEQRLNELATVRRQQQ